MLRGALALAVLLAETGAGAGVAAVALPEDAVDCAHAIAAASGTSAARRMTELMSRLQMWKTENGC